MITLRKARSDDLAWLISELVKFDAFVDAPVSLIEDKAHARKTLAGMIDQHYFRVAEEDCEMTGYPVPVGFLAALAIPHPFNPRRVLLSEQFWWVTPSARGTRAGAMLLNEYIEYGKANADVFTIALEAQSPIKQQSLEKRGFRLAERSFVFDSRCA